MDIYDIAIIGSGPAGLSAAVNCKIRNKKVILFGVKDLSKKLIQAPEINNYLGLSKITGLELRNKFQAHLASMGLGINTDSINGVYAMGEYFSLMGKGTNYNAKAVIIATGIEFGKNIKGEEKYVGSGVSYCATCDAPLYKGKEVAVVGYSKEAEEEGRFLAEVASKVFYIPMYKDSFTMPHNVEIINKKVLEIERNSNKMIMKFEDKDLSVDGIFSLKDTIAPSNLVPGLNTEDGFIKVERDMSTNLKGLFACGDCTGKPYQYMKACGEGQVAGLSAVSYLDSLAK